MDKYLSLTTMLKNHRDGFVLAAIGKPGCGKTYLIKKCITSGFPKGFFTYILIICPSDLEYKDMVPPNQITVSFSVEWLNKMINMINLTGKEKKQRSDVLIIMDDCVSTLKENEKAAKTISIFFNRRHLLWNGTISMIITSQKYTMLPAKYRSVLTHIAIFGVSPFDYTKIMDESIVTLTKKEWKELITQIYKIKFSCLIIEITSQQYLII